jgi:hypothetical protein
MWSFEQPQGLAFTEVQVNVRMTVTKLSDGSLLLYNPIAPTQECLDLLAELEAEVKYIVLGSAAYEHKVRNRTSTCNMSYTSTSLRKLNISTGSRGSSHAMNMS